MISLLIIKIVQKLMHRKEMKMRIDGEEEEE